MVRVGALSLVHIEMEISLELVLVKLTNKFGLFSHCWLPCAVLVTIAVLRVQWPGI